MRPVFIVAIALCLCSSAAEAKSRRPRAKRSKVMTMSATAYCTHGETADGSLTRPGVVAADPRVLPFGTILRISGPPEVGPGAYTVSDKGPAIKGRELDIFMPSCRDARRFGRKQVQVTVVRVGATTD